MDMTFILQAMLGVLMLFFGIILNGLRNDMKADRETTVASLKEVRDDLKQLNDAVLGKYVSRDDYDRKWEDHIKEEARLWEVNNLDMTRRTDERRNKETELRNEIHLINVTLASMQGKSYGEK